MYKRIRAIIVASSLILIVALYWVGKSPANFRGASLPDFSFILIMFFSVLGLYQIFKERQGHELSELLFPFMLVLVPLFGNIADFILNAKPSSLWVDYIDYSLLDVNNWMGFRSPIISAVTFAFAARYIANCLSEKLFVISLIFGALPHLIWGAAQFLYLFAPSLLESLPILVGEQVGSDFNLIIVRASGLMLNAFPFAWFFVVLGVSLKLVSRTQGAVIISILISALSISRAFIVATMPLLLYSLAKGRRSVLAFFVALTLVTGIYFGSDLALILDKRLDGDISSQSRFATNMLSINEIVGGNYLGVGYSHAFYTDSTAASLLLSSGIPGIFLYFLAWFLFFRRLWIVSGYEIEVLFFGMIFFLCSLLVGSVEAQPGLLILFVLYWVLKKRSSENTRGRSL
jgi:hypothetical protein